MRDWGEPGRILVGLNCAPDLGAYFPQNHVRIRRRWAQDGALGRILAVASIPIVEGILRTILTDLSQNLTLYYSSAEVH